MGVERHSAPTADGAPIAWRTVGGGEGVVIAPGSLSDGSDWLGLAERIADTFTVHVVSRRAAGGSARSIAYSVEQEYDDLVAVLKATKSTRLVGHSFGAICALGAALVHRDVDRLVAYEPPLSIHEPVVPADALADVEAAAGRGDLDTVVDIGLRRCVRLADAQVDALRRTRAWQDMVQHGAKWALELRALHEMDPGAGRYAAIVTPTLLPVGATTPKGHHHRVAAEALAATLPNSRVVEIAGAAHLAHLEAPDALARALREFLRTD